MLFSDSLSTSDIVKGLNLQNLTKRKWYVQGTCAVNGEGIYEGMHELSDMVKEFKHGQRASYWNCNIKKDLRLINRAYGHLFQYVLLFWCWRCTEWLFNVSEHLIRAVAITSTNGDKSMLQWSIRYMLK